MEVLVEYEYIAVEDDELTIRRGDIISNVERLSDGWMEGDLDGRRGAFPDNFVKEIKKEVKAKEPSKKGGGGHVADLANKLGHQGIKMGPPPNNAVKVTKRDQSRRKLRAKVAYSYTPANDDELRLEVGEVVEVLKQEEEGWWEGTVNGRTGVFPSNFVEVVPQETEVEEKPQNQISNDKEKKKHIKGVGLGDIFKDGPINLRPTGEISKPQERAEPKPVEDKTASLKKNTTLKAAPALPPKDVTENKKVERAKVLFSYVAENDDELSITEGDIIQILEKELEDSGWWKGELNGKVGVFPDNFVEILPPEETKPKKPPPPSITKPSVQEAERPLQRPGPANVEPKPKQEEKKPAPALPTKKPAMPPPPISKKPLGPKHPADLIAQTDDHKVKESQKESGIGAGKSADPAPKGRMGKLPAPRPHTALPEQPKVTTNNTEEIDLDIVPTAEPLSHLNANRAKVPQRRPPTIHNRDEEAPEPLRQRPGPISRPAPPLPKNDPPPSPSPVPHADDIDSASHDAETARAVTDLRHELEVLRSTTVPKQQYEALEKEVNHLRELTSKLEKLTAVLMNDIDEGAKERRSMQVEIDRIRKLSLLPGNPSS